jgi:hypothetical protein
MPMFRRYILPPSSALEFVGWWNVGMCRQNSRRSEPVHCSYCSGPVCTSPPFPVGLSYAFLCNVPIYPNEFLTINISTLNMKFTFSSETSVSASKTTRCHNPQYYNMNNHKWSSWPLQVQRWCAPFLLSDIPSNFHLRFRPLSMLRNSVFRELYQMIQLRFQWLINWIRIYY